MAPGGHPGKHLGHPEHQLSLVDPGGRQLGHQEHQQNMLTPVICGFLLIA